MKFRPTRRGLTVVLILGGLVAWLWRDSSVLPSSTPMEMAAKRPVPPHPATSSVVDSGTSRRAAVTRREVLAANWKTDAHPAFAAFRDWTARYLAASPAERLKLLAEGIALAQARRGVMAQLIRDDPRAALAAAVPMVVRQQLPGAIVDLLEDRVSGRGQLSLLSVTPLPGTKVMQPSYRTTLIDGQEYTAYVYGRRETQATVSSTSIVGVAIDHALAISESPLRVLEAGEIAGDRPLDLVCAISGLSTAVGPDTPLNEGGEATAVEYNGKVQVLCHIGHVTDLEKQLYADEVDHIQVAGDNQPGTSGVTGRPITSWTHGPKKMLVILVDFPDLLGPPLNTYIDNQPITPATIDNVINSTNGVRDFYVNGSYNQTAIQLAITPTDINGYAPDVTPVLHLTTNAATYAAAGDNSTLHTDARLAAKTLSAKYDENNYDRVGVVFTSLASLPSSQITYGGLGEVIGKYFWVNGEFDLRVVAHEVGHNYGLNHANLWQVSDGSPISPSGTSVEYGDVNDVMGSGSTSVNEFTHWNKSMLQWIPDSDVTLASSAGTYRIYRFDGGTATNLANSRALKIVRDGVHDYWIGYRRGDGNASLTGGAYIIWGYNYNRQGELLDMTTPGVNPSGVHDEGLAIGATFNDTVAGITIQPVAQGGSGSEEYLDVTVGFQPKVQFSQTSYSVDEQSGSATLTVSRTQNSVGAVSVNYATAPGTATTPANYTTQNGTVSWADGDSADKIITIPLNTAAVLAGSVNFTVTLSGVTGAVLGGNSTATVSIVGPGVRDAGFNADFVNNTVQKVLPLPDGSMVIGGWFSQEQDSGFNLYSHGGAARLTSIGSIDTGFAAGAGAAGGNLYGGGYTVVFDLAQQPDGKIIVAGEFTTYNGAARNRILRLNTDGTVDSTFNPGTGADNTIYAVLVQPDGKLLIGGAFITYNGTAREYLARLNADGSLDTSFVGPAFVDPGGGQVQSLAMQSDGKILAGGFFNFSGAALKASVCRVLSTGALDPAFNGISNGANYPGSPSYPGYVYKVVVQADGQILIGGYFDGYNNAARGGLARLTSTGSIDASFAPTSNGSVNTILFQPDGRILIGGNFTNFNGSPASNLARLSSSGTFDTSFAAAGGYGAEVQDLELLSNGRVLLGGNYSNFQGSAAYRPVWQFFPGLSGLPGTVQFTSTGYAGNAGTTAALSVTRMGGSLGALTVGYATVPGTATTADYTSASGVLTWADGDSSTKTINVPLVADASAPASEAFTVNLGQPLIGGTLLGSVQQATVQINYVPPPGFVTWQNAKFTAAELLDANISGPNAIYGQDGLPNLVKYALGLEPKQNITSGLPTVGTLGSDWVYTYTRPDSTTITDVTYSVEVSTDLVSWSSVGVIHEMVSSVGGIETWRGRYPMASAPNVFFRLKVIH